MRQELRLLTSRDGIRIAYARQGHGPPLVRAAHWLSHLEYDWQSPVWHDFLTALGRDRTLVRYDERGTGLSDREVEDLSFEAMVGDLEALGDAIEIDRFALLGMSQGAAIAVAYAARHPERVTALVLAGGYARGHAHRGRTPEQRADAEILLQLIRSGWGTASPKFRRVFATMFFPDGTPAEFEAFDELQRLSASPDVAYRLRRMFDEIDVTELCPTITVPTLVLHARDDGVVPFEEGRLLASLIPNARFVPLEGRNHILRPGSPAWATFFDELDGFLGGHQRGAAPGPRQHDRQLDTLSARELEVLSLVAEGRTNAEIAAGLFLSPRTVDRHLANAYTKLGLTGKAARAAAAARLSRQVPEG